MHSDMSSPFNYYIDDITFFFYTITLLLQVLCCLSAELLSTMPGNCYRSTTNSYMYSFLPIALFQTGIGYQIFVVSSPSFKHNLSLITL